ncbi:ribosome biogenesis protein Nsa2, partial [Apiospora hydei]
HGRRFDHEERSRKKEARQAHKQSEDAQNLRGLRAKLNQQKRHKEKIQMRKQLKAHEERDVKSAGEKDPSAPSAQLPARPKQPIYCQGSVNLHQEQAKGCRCSIAYVPVSEIDNCYRSMVLPLGVSRTNSLTLFRIVLFLYRRFKVIQTGKKVNKKSWKRMITKPTFVGPDFTRRPVKYERFIRPMGLRYKKTVMLPILAVKKNPSNPLYTQLGVLSKGTILEINVSELGLTTTSGKVIWGRFAQVTNNPDMDGTVNAVLLV